MERDEQSFNPNAVSESSPPPRAIICWPEGLSGSPVILPIGETFEESEQILELPEGAVLD